MLCQIFQVIIIYSFHASLSAFLSVFFLHLFSIVYLGKIYICMFIFRLYGLWGGNLLLVIIAALCGSFGLCLAFLFRLF
jgi:hypothetical protein